MASAKSASRRRLPDLDTVYTINADGSRNFLHPADVKGRWQWIKRAVWGVLIAAFFGLPLVHVGGKPVLHIDIPGRAAHVFGQSFTNQDFYLLFFLFTAIGFVFFVATSLWGRIWCGTACPHTVWLEGVFRPIERWIEGPRERRIRRNMGKMTADKFWRKAVKHTLYVIISFVVAHTFIAYFLPVKEMIEAMQSSPREHWAAFVWGIAWTGAIYFDNAWFREQLCLVICPYGRLQSALIDADTMVIGYDETRGEPRSKKSEDGGDCIDCGRCVAVCPTGIDIRNGLQLECVACANCIDACNDIMDRVGRKRGLIRYDSHHGFEGARRSLFRPRVYLYALMGLVGLSVATFALLRRDPFEAHLLRARGLPYQLTESEIRNVSSLRIQNKTSVAQTYFIDAESEREDARIVVAMERIRLEALSDQTVPVVVSVDRGSYEGAFGFAVSVRDSASARESTIKQRFLGP